MGDEEDVLPVTVTMGPDGILKGVTLEQIRSIGLGNILEVRSHVILREGDLTVHRIEFLNGGTASLKYSSDGTLHQFEGHQISINIRDGRDVVLNALSR
jgi:hypothetical protein